MGTAICKAIHRLFRCLQCQTPFGWTRVARKGVRSLQGHRHMLPNTVFDLDRFDRVHCEACPPHLFKNTVDSSSPHEVINNHGEDRESGTAK